MLIPNKAWIYWSKRLQLYKSKAQEMHVKAMNGDWAGISLNQMTNVYFQVKDCQEILSRTSPFVSEEDKDASL